MSQVIQQILLTVVYIYLIFLLILEFGHIYAVLFELKNRRVTNIMNRRIIEADARATAEANPQPG